MSTPEETGEESNCRVLASSNGDVKVEIEPSLWNTSNVVGYSKANRSCLRNSMGHTGDTAFLLHVTLPEECPKNRTLCPLSVRSVLKCLTDLRMWVLSV